jgi:phytanoyl-CoA hydroxylase
MDVIEFAEGFAEVVSRFRRNGFVAVSLFGDSEVERLREEVNRITTDPGGVNVGVEVFALSPEPLSRLGELNPYGIFRVVNVPLCGDAWRRLINDERTAGIAALLLGADTDFHMGFLRLRPPRVAVADDIWHRDLDTDRHDCPKLVTAILYLDDMLAEDGPTLVVPGSHLDAYDEAEGTTRQWNGQLDSAMEVTVPAGTVLFLDALTVHRSGVNTGVRHRSLVLYEYKAAGAVSLNGQHYAFEGVPVVRDGSIVDVEIDKAGT